MILHGLWWNSRLHVLGRSAHPAADNHSEPAATDRLREIVGDWTEDALLASVAEDASVALQLPPAPRGGLMSTKRTTFPTLAFSPADTIDLLSSLPSPVPRSCGDSLRFWSLLARYSLSALANQQFVPDIEHRGDGSYAALWRPFAQTRDELAWLEKFAAVMPPVCSAADGTAGDLGLGPIRQVEDFVGATVNAVILRTIAEDAFFERIHERAKRESSDEVRYLSALLSEDRTITGNSTENALLADQVRTWVGQLEESGTGEPLRLCFSLIEPEESGVSDLESTILSPPRGPWRVELHLQALGDPLKRFDIAQVWLEHGGRPTLLGRHLGHRRDQLLAELARAKEAIPALNALPANAPPTVIELTTNEAHAFLRESVPVLSARGFGVTLPTWAGQQERRLGLQLFVKPHQVEPGVGTPSNRALGLESLLEFDWRVAVGDVQLSAAEFEQLAAQHTPLVKYGDAWLELDTETARRALEFVREQPTSKMSLRSALRLAYGAEDTGAGLPILGLSGDSWIESLLADVPTAKIESLPQPTRFRGSLRPYQQRGLEWLVFLDALGIGACLADDMGLGKTIQLIALLLHEREHRTEVGPTLLFAPASVVGNWEREIERFTGNSVEEPASGLRVLVHHGPDRLTGDEFMEAAPKHDVIITTYALGYRDLAILREVEWERIVLDEAQKIKNPQAAQTIAIRALPDSRRVALTGTPIENHLSELWSIMDMLNPGLLGTAGQFRKRFLVPIEKLGDQRRGAQLRRMLQPFMLRRAKTDPGIICDLPEKMEMRVFCNLTQEQAGLYQRIVEDTLTLVDAVTGIRRRGLILSMLTRLKQACNHPCHLQGETGPLDQRSGKCERLVEMLEEVLAEGDSALVFTQYRQMGHLLEQMIADRLRTEVQFLHGGTPIKRRDQMVERFQDPDGGVRIFLLSLKAGGLGLNLTAANHVFHFDRWWNPAVEDQATDRAHRVGQERRVQVHKFVCIGTVEDRIDRMLERKQALADAIIRGGDDWLTSLSTEELRDYVRLSREAVG